MPPPITHSAQKEEITMKLLLTMLMLLCLITPALADSGIVTGEVDWDKTSGVITEAYVSGGDSEGLRFFFKPAQGQPTVACNGGANNYYIIQANEGSYEAHMFNVLFSDVVEGVRLQITWDDNTSVSACKISKTKLVP